MTPYYGYFCVGGVVKSQPFQDAFKKAFENESWNIENSFERSKIIQELYDISESPYRYFLSDFKVERDEYVEDILMTMSEDLQARVMFFGRPRYQDENFQDLSAHSSERSESGKRPLIQAANGLIQIEKCKFTISNKTTYYEIPENSNIYFVLRNEHRLKFIESLKNVK